jgi:hypothetical protein
MISSVTTGFGHLLFSAALLRSGSLLFPAGIHLGINWSLQNLFSQDPGNDSRGVLFRVITPESEPGFAHTLINIAITLACYAVMLLILRIRQRERQTTA